MKFGDSFTEIFEENFNITKETVLLCRNSPDQSQKLKFNVQLFFKRFDHPKLTNLLVATQIVNGEELLAFAYWIPESLFIKGQLLIDLLKSFANVFGCEIRVADAKGKFIESKQLKLTGPVGSDMSFFEVLGDVEIPCQYYLFFHEVQDSSFHEVIVSYCFSVNNNLYNLWFQDIATALIRVPKGWYNRYTEIAASLNPHGKTDIGVFPPKRLKVKSEEELKQTIDTDSFEPQSIEIPRRYAKRFERLTSVILSTDDSQKVGTSTKLEKDPCVFCGAKNDSQEHIFSKWLRDFFPDKELDIELQFNRADDAPSELFSTGINVKKLKLYGLVTYKVCVDCNNNWMSKLESQVKDIFKSQAGFLIKYNDLKSLPETKKVALSRWLCQKALLLVLEMKLPTQLRKKWFQDLMAGNIPKDFLIEYSDFGFYDFEFVGSVGATKASGGVKVKTLSSEEGYTLAEDFLKVSFQIGELFFRVSYFDENKPLKRTSFIKKTDVLYPSGYALEFVQPTNEVQAIWDTLDNNLKMHFIQLMGLMLDEK